MQTCEDVRPEEQSILAVCDTLRHREGSPTQSGVIWKIGSSHFSWHTNSEAGSARRE